MKATTPKATLPRLGAMTGYKDYLWGLDGAENYKCRSDRKVCHSMLFCGGGALILLAYCHLCLKLYVATQGVRQVRALFYNFNNFKAASNKAQ